MCRQRLTPAAFNQTIPLAQNFGPENGVEAGILDRAVAAVRAAVEAAFPS